MQCVAGVMLKRLAANVSGVALVEFALCFPVLLALFVGGVTVSELSATNRKVTVAARELTDLVSRSMSPALIYNNPGGATARQQLSAGAVALSPLRLNNATQQISLLRVCDSTHAYVVWTRAQTQNGDGTTITPTTSNQTGGTIPENATQSADNIVAIPADMVTSTMVPTSPDGSNVCQNLAPGTSTRTQVGTAGGWLFRGQITYNFSPSISLLPFTTRQLNEVIYMAPRLF